jgi:hypothetical protein
MPDLEDFCLLGDGGGGGGCFLFVWKVRAFLKVEKFRV